MIDIAKLYTLHELEKYFLKNVKILTSFNTWDILDDVLLHS